MDEKNLKKAIQRGRYEWRKHTLERLIERFIAQDDVLDVLLNGGIIEDYPTDTPYPSSLFFAKIRGRALHVVAAFDEADDWAYIITAYIPDRDHFEADLKTRRKR
jgi:hypothetical protein